MPLQFSFHIFLRPGRDAGCVCARGDVLIDLICISWTAHSHSYSITRIYDGYDGSRRLDILFQFFFVHSLLFSLGPARIATRYRNYSNELNCFSIIQSEYISMLGAGCLAAAVCGKHTTSYCSSQIILRAKNKTHGGRSVSNLSIVWQKWKGMDFLDSICMRITHYTGYTRLYPIMPEYTIKEITCKCFLFYQTSAIVRGRARSKQREMGGWGDSSPNRLSNIELIVWNSIIIECDLFHFFIYSIFCVAFVRSFVRWLVRREEIQFYLKHSAIGRWLDAYLESSPRTFRIGHRIRACARGVPRVRHDA